MTLSNVQSLKTNKLSPIASLGLIVSIFILTSSVMCLAMAMVAIILPGVNIAIFYLLGASLVLGLIGTSTIRRLLKTQHVRLPFDGLLR